MLATVSLRSSNNRLETLAAGERQQLIGQLRAALRRRAHIAESLRHPTVDASGGKSFLQKADIAEYDGEKVVEIMRHP
jgi:hypothetical protein